MPSARAEEFRGVAAKLGFRKTWQIGSHERWQHPDGRDATIPVHGGREIGPPLFHRIANQLGIDLETFGRLRQDAWERRGDQVLPPASLPEGLAAGLRAGR